MAHTQNWVAVLTMSFLCFFNLLMMAVKRKLIFFFVSPVCLVMVTVTVAMAMAYRINFTSPWNIVLTE